MKRFETKNYIFNYHENSLAENDILEIAKLQESCFEYICHVLKVRPDFKIEYTLCETPEEVGHIFGDDIPCNGYSDLPHNIYAVYNEKKKCIGFHEDAHVISYSINIPDYPAFREGLAMYFDRKWWGIQNLDWTGYYIKTNKYISADQLLDEDMFYDQDCAITYPIMGAFTDWLISSYGIDKYIEFYKNENLVEALEVVYGKTAKELNQSFVDYVELFRIDEVLEQRMKDLLNN